MNPGVINMWFLAAEDHDLAVHLWSQSKYAHAILFSQQAVEKVLKAYIQMTSDRDVPLTHNLIDLLRISGLSLPPEYDLALLKELSVAYVRTRYDDMSYRYYSDPASTKALYQFGHDLYLWILRHRQTSNA